jgi:soluble lytic murein transglycosylase
MLQCKILFSKAQSSTMPRILNRIGLVILLMADVAFPLASAQEAHGDRLFLEAREAFRLGRRARLETLAADLNTQGHILADYADYYLLRQGLEKLEDDAPVQAFILRQGKSYLGERMRADWIKTLVDRGNWQEAARQASRLVAPDQETRCLALLARIRLRQPDALAEGRALWGALGDGSGGCQSLMLGLETHMTPEQRWVRIRFLFELNRLKPARSMLLALPQGPDARQLNVMLDKPAVWLTRLAPGRPNDRATRGLVALAMQRLARNDPAFAAGQMERWGASLDADERAWVWGQIGLQGALRHMDAASVWFARSHPAQLSRDGAEWRVRAALRRKDWVAVRAAIEDMPSELREKPEWIYWLGRASKAFNRKDEARQLFARLSGQPHFYGNLADEELGNAVVVPPLAKAVQPAELAAARANPGLNRALAFFRLDLRLEGLREWNWTVRAMNDRALLAAAELARQNQVYDRAIQAADRTQSQHDYRLRFLSPFLEQVRPVAREQGVDDAWVYGLIRQESRFILSAKSSVGASGLMQLMPATARWVARKIGLADYDPRRVQEPEINLRLGTAYMRMVLEALDGHFLLASAAYNAGPGRARKWRADGPLEGAIYAETIPFDETRDYVKKVMSNTLYYALLFDGKSAPLYARLGSVAGRNASARPVNLP